MDNKMKSRQEEAQQVMHTSVLEGSTMLASGHPHVREMGSFAAGLAQSTGYLDNGKHITNQGSSLNQQSTYQPPFPYKDAGLMEHAPFIESKKHNINDIIKETIDLQDQYYATKNGLNMVFFKEYMQNVDNANYYGDYNTDMRYYIPSSFKAGSSASELLPDLTPLYHEGVGDMGLDYAEAGLTHSVQVNHPNTGSIWSEDGHTANFDYSPNVYKDISSTNLDFENEESRILDNGIVKETSFPSLAIPEFLQNRFLKRYMNENHKDLREMFSKEFDASYRPVWNSSTIHIFWISLLNQASILEAYFEFFIDRGLNLLLRSCHKTFGNKATISKKYEEFGKFYSEIEDDAIPEDSSPVKELLHSTHEVQLFTRKSYKYYGKLLSAIRMSVDKLHIEYAAKLSLFSAWSTFFHLSSTLDTLCVIYTGFSSLCVKILTEVGDYKEVTPTIKVCLGWIERACTSSIIPEYPFLVVDEMYRDFLGFKTFLMKYGASDSAENKNSDRIKTLSSQFDSKTWIYDFYSLETFFEDLINHVNPEIRRINEELKRANGIEDASDKIHFASLGLLFKLVLRCFSLSPTDVISSRSAPFKKVFSLFYAAIIRALANIYTPIRSLIMVDLTNMTCPKEDFDYGKFTIPQDQLTHEEHKYLDRLSKKLLRIIHFFNYRNQIYFHIISTHTVLNESFVRQPKSIHSSEKSDVAQLVTPKLKYKEEFICSFENESIRPENYPQIGDLEFLPSYLEVYKRKRTNGIQQNTERNTDSQTFDYDKGLYSSDFDASEIIDCLKESKKNYHMLHPPAITDLRHRFHTLDTVRRQISEMIR